MSIHSEIELLEAKKILESGNIVAIPTETVYGLAANVFNEVAISKIFKTKNRPQDNPLIVHIKGKSSVEEVAKDIPDVAYKLMDKFWPGPLTLVLQKNEAVPETVTAGKNTVAVRMPNHPLILQLLESLPFPLVAPSANRSNHISPTSPKHVKKSLKENTPFILNGGKCAQGIESTIIGFKEDHLVLYRKGNITIDELEISTGMEVKSAVNSRNIVAPGMKSKHYSPSTPFITTTTLEKTIRDNSNKKIGLILQGPKKHPEVEVVKYLSCNGNLKEAASNLYAYMHELDELNLDLIIAEFMPNEGIGSSINDRLQRANNQ